MGVGLFFGYDWFGGWNVFLIHLGGRSQMRKRVVFGAR